jgi:hypothetical protein
MVEPQPSKLVMRVRFSSPAPCPPPAPSPPEQKVKVRGCAELPWLPPGKGRFVLCHIRASELLHLPVYGRSVNAST